jgi:hypothetical protein
LLESVSSFPGKCMDEKSTLFCFYIGRGKMFLGVVVRCANPVTGVEVGFVAKC